MKELTHEVESFIRIIIPAVLKDKKLLLPKQFNEKYGDELSKFVRLINPVGGIWKVAVERFHNSVLLSDGLQKFMTDHSIHSGSLLIFRYRGKAEFYVHLFDLTATEIQYPSSVRPEMPNDKILSEGEFCNGAIVVKQNVKEEKEDDEDDGNPSIAIIDSPYPSTRLRSSKRLALMAGQNQVSKRRKQEAHPRNSDNQSSSSLDVLEPESSNDLNEESCSKRHKSSSRDTKKENKALEAAESYKTANPSFVVLMKTYHIYKATIVAVPCSFSREYIRSLPEFINLQDSDNKKWPIRCIKRCGRVMSLSQGWANFVRNKEVEPGDACVFELDPTGDALLKVIIFRASDFYKD
ncbi:hypothetical protein M9H77_27910 [Catharanthus roseus]|uniref:Uncharacterized protein n=1 Tax=Catharanthus roseus TaxID=4058 RepID=A0ACC0AGI4_CATRO|nr:hypothetical protein M9H77_27910 [Catharanthus roseus]